MDENLKDKEVLLVVDSKGSKINVVQNLDNEGNLETLSPNKKNESAFLKIDKNGNALENFFTNMLRQFKNPTHLQFFKMPLENIEQNGKKLLEMLSNPKENKDFLDKYRINPEDYAQKDAKEQEQTKSAVQMKPEYSTLIDESKINWDEMKKFGVTRDVLEKTNSLQAMLNFQKSPVLISVSANLGTAKIETDARLAFRQAEDGSVTLAIHGIQKQPELDRPFYGYEFTEDDKKNLLATKNLGKTIDLQMPNNENPTAFFVSVDRLTNELVLMRADKIKIPDEIKGVALNDKQKEMLREGKSVYLEGMTAKSGKNFDAFVQVNADKHGLEFRFDNEQNQQLKNTQRVKDGVYIPEKIGGVVLQKQDVNKLKEGGTVYVSGMKDKQGVEYNAYIKVNSEKGKLDFFKYNPDKKQNVTPDNASKTQVAVNSEGKTNEATKNIKEPLQKGQQQPTEKQEQKEIKLKKSRGVKV